MYFVQGLALITMQKKIILNSPRLLELKKHKRKIFLSKFCFVLIGLIIIFVGLGFLSRINRLNITNININGNKIVEVEEIKEKVDQNLLGYYLWLFPKTNIFFYPKSKIIQSLSTEIKRLKDINLTINDSGTLEVLVKERTGLYTWCGVIFEPVSDKSSMCYFLDEDGFMFDEAPYFSGEVYFKFYGETVDSYFAKNNFTKLVLFKEILQQMGLKPVMLYKMGNSDVKILLSATKFSTTNPEIIFKTDADLDIMAENLDAALDTEPLKTDFPKKYSSLLYIDLRYGNKVVYKFK